MGICETLRALQDVEDFTIRNGFYETLRVSRGVVGFKRQSVFLRGVEGFTRRNWLYRMEGGRIWWFTGCPGLFEV